MELTRILQGIVLQYRSLQNVLSKWLEPEWLPPLLACSRGRTPVPDRSDLLPRLSCCWNQTATATGRLSSSSPNLQAVTKYEVVVQMDASMGAEVATGGEASGDGAVVRVVARDSFVAPAGRVLVAADYSQVELRLLAHLSGDLRLQELLRRDGTAGEGGDAFRHIAAAWLRPNTAPADISSRDREQVKRVVYGIIYGMTPQGLAQQLAEHGVSLEEATALRASFLRHFAGVQAFITSSLHHARRHGYVTTGLLGRRRPIVGLSSGDPRVRGDAERKVVNSIVQGSAADLVKSAMCLWATYNHPDTPREVALHQQAMSPHSGRAVGPMAADAAAAAPWVQPPSGAELVAQIHDELMFECDAQPKVVRQLICAVRDIMCGVVQLDVPLQVKVAVGQSWGNLKELPAALDQLA